jgi:hypothetical protein
MSADIEHMEHRWGTRVELDVRTEVRSDDGYSASGYIRNASVSGAYVETDAILPLLSCISLRAQHWEEDWLDACIVRVDETGLAVEWLDPGSHMVPALLSLRRDSRGEVLQTLPERVFTVHASSRA